MLASEPRGPHRAAVAQWRESPRRNHQQRAPLSPRQVHPFCWRPSPGVPIAPPLRNGVRARRRNHQQRAPPAAAKSPAAYPPQPSGQVHPTASRRFFFTHKCPSRNRIPALPWSRLFPNRNPRSLLATTRLPTPAPPAFHPSRPVRHKLTLPLKQPSTPAPAHPDSAASVFSELSSGAPSGRRRLTPPPARSRSCTATRSFRPASVRTPSVPRASAHSSPPTPETPPAAHPHGTAASRSPTTPPDTPS